MQTAGDGSSVADHLAVVRARSPEIDEDAPECPREGVYLWNSWCELHQGRGSSGFGPVPISWTEMDAYCRLSGVDLQPWEVRAIRAIEGEFMASWAEANSDGG